MENISVTTLVVFLFLLLCLAAFFSAAETSMMAIDRYRLRHAARVNKTAKSTKTLLERPDKLLGVILIGTTIANIFASATATILVVRLWGEASVLIGTIILTIVILIFAEMLPKTLSALYPDRVAYPSSYILRVALKIFYPIVWLGSGTTNLILRIFGVDPKKSRSDSLSREELRTVVNEAGGLIPNKHRRMLLQILDLEKMTVDDVMIPRNELIGIDIEDEWEDILKQLAHSQHTTLPVFNQDLDNLIGTVHLRKAAYLIRHEDFNKDMLLDNLDEAYFIPEGTPLHTQLLYFQQNKKKLGFVVDEYGDIQGLVTIEEILEEIVGEFTTHLGSISHDIHPQADGSFLIDGAANIREINRTLGWHLPTEGAKTLNGVITDYLEAIPEVGTCILLNGYPIEVVQLLDNMVKTTKIFKRLPQKNNQ